ncbi:MULTISPECIES: PepSY-associated TM helix domain-containing protein [unclassified Nocardioides]|uniref:PepSY-associated TM helix domain-containing protein n=1 Tax=unclassified Nocardioides TaxID=2615069 RepID=UPI0019102E34|nr:MULTISPECIES: PepSY domain-containing protein [unclassified Nocardioides]
MSEVSDARTPVRSHRTSEMNPSLGAPVGAPAAVSTTDLRPAPTRPERRRPTSTVGAALRPLARRVHLLAGILVAPLLLVLCLTGLVYVFSPQIHESLYASQLFVDTVGEERRPVAEQVAVALAAHPEGELQSVVPPSEPDRTTRVNLSVPGNGDPSHARTVFVDPYTNYINGEMNTEHGRLPANVWLRDLHANLHLGKVGRLYSETAASWLPVIGVGGLLLWLIKQGRRARTAREFLVPAPRGKGAQLRLKSVHGPLGFWAFALLLVTGVTGLMMSPFAGPRLFDARPPRLGAAPVDVPVPAKPIGVDAVLHAARDRGLSGTLEVTPSAAPGQVFTVTETSPGLPVHRTAVAVDPYTGRITEQIGWDDYSLLAQIRTLGIELHTGTLFGLANQVLLAVFAVATIVLIAGGYRMWWKRSPYRGQLPPAPLPALRQVPLPLAAVAVLVAVVLGWYLPMFGASLAAFVLVDIVINAIRRRRQRSPKVPTPPRHAAAAQVDVPDPMRQTMDVPEGVVEFKRRGASRWISVVLQMVLRMVLLALALGALHLAYQEPTATTVVPAAALSLAFLVLGFRSSSSPARLKIEDGTLDIVASRSHYRFDLSKPGFRLEMPHPPESRKWKVLVHRTGLAPYAIDASMVAPAEFTTALRRYRPEL